MSEQADILGAVESGDVEAAEQAVSRNLANGYPAVARHLTGNDAGDPFDIDTF